jgi:hypothetical protein
MAAASEGFAPREPATVATLGAAHSAPREPAAVATLKAECSAPREPATAALRAERVALQQGRPQGPMPNRQRCSGSHDVRTRWIDWTSVISLLAAAELGARGKIAPKIRDGEAFVGRPDRRPMRSLESCAQNSFSPPASILAVVYPTNITARLSMRGRNSLTGGLAKSPGRSHL